MTSLSKPCTGCGKAEPDVRFNKVSKARGSKRLARCAACEKAYKVTKKELGLAGLKVRSPHPKSHIKDGVGFIALAGKYGEGHFAKVSIEDFNRLKCYRWIARKAHTGELYAECNSLPLHKAVLDIKRTDHADGDTLNNQRDNLRPCTPLQNAWNKRAIVGTSQYKNVGKRRSGRWQVRITTASGERLCLGMYDSEIEAAKAADEAAKLHHGKFARLNFP